MGFPTQSTTMRVKVTEVNMAERHITVKDAYGKSYQLLLDFLDSTVAIPAYGEMWTIRRRGNDWVLDGRLENGTETTKLTALLPGDRRVEAQGTLFLNGSDVLVNGAPIFAPGMIMPLLATAQIPTGWVQWAGATPPTGTIYIRKL